MICIASFDLVSPFGSQCNQHCLVFGCLDCSYFGCCISSALGSGQRLGFNSCGRAHVSNPDADVGFGARLGSCCVASVSNCSKCSSCLNRLKCLNLSVCEHGRGFAFSGSTFSRRCRLSSPSSSQLTTDCSLTRTRARTCTRAFQGNRDMDSFASSLAFRTAFMPARDTRESEPPSVCCSCSLAALCPKNAWCLVGSGLTQTK